MQSSIEILHRLNDEYIILNDKLSAVKNVQSGEKLSIFGDKLYIDNYYYHDYLKWMQPVVRYITNQSREHIINYLKKKLEDYNLKIQTIRNISSIYSQDLEFKKIVLMSIKKQTIDLQEGLENIKKTYLNDEINTIINTFNTDMNKLNL